MMQKRVYIVYTGGTIGMERSDRGYVPMLGSLQRKMNEIRELNPDLKPEIMPDYQINEYNPLLDSSNMEPADWLVIADDIKKNYDKYDGFIVLHGTDTMAYTASALSFMLEGLEKPVIFTGSQIPLCEVRNDARDNLITAMLIAAHYKIPEVCLYFNCKLFRGCRSLKVNADGLDAFDSPNFLPLGKAGVDIKINWDLIHQPSEKNKLKIHQIEKHSIAALRLFPGISAGIVENLLKPPLKGLVLETFGIGNGPEQNKDFIDVLAKAANRRDEPIVIVATTQCLQGIVDLNKYGTGSALAKAGVISGYDMTTEAALAKLYYLFSSEYSVEDVKKKMQENLRGELTLPKV